MKQFFSRSILTALLIIFGLNLSAQTTEKEWNTLIRAMIQCESKGNPKVRNGQYVGVLQISPICVRAVNQISTKKFSYNDRLNREKSIEMFNIFMDRYNPDHDIEKAIRMWSGGVRYSVKRTQKNYNKVIAVYNRMMAEDGEASSTEAVEVDEPQPAVIDDAEPAGEE
ncbi:MAG: hypothetical protein J5784_02880 [Muribaculaceae bacterium]|nr:hypothetical protein [Muribaculaceae bacterium]MBR4722413.1 hypothetical protein [Muribaculaceae bacterium]MBR5745125.1 hypothetical protein [Muribaculaceae bacterium]